MNNNIQVFIFVGRSGCGKGTQLELFKKFLLSKNKDLNIKSMIMGDIYRAFFKESGFVEDVARHVSMTQGKFQPDFLTNALLINKAISLVEDNSIIFFDGYPRTLSQLGVLKDFLTYIGSKEPIIINIEVSRENVKERMLGRGRGDDNVDAIESRLNEYDKFILPMLENIQSDSYFKYFKIDGEHSKEDVHNEIINSLNHII